MTLIELYQWYGEGGERGDNARALINQTHWFTVNADFDPKTGEALPQALSGFLAKITRKANAETLHDRLWRITEHARSSVERLCISLNKSPRREQALLPARAVRELDVSSFIKLCNRPGRNIREKLADKPYLQAVRRYQSVNLHENCLLKAFVTRLAGLLELRHELLFEEEDELLLRIRSWLLSDEAKSIAQWDNLPPNNTLLSHRNYRRVWDAWCWLQTLDDDIARDFSSLEKRAETMRIWNEYAQKYSDGKCLFAEMPVFFDYEKYEIRPWLSKLEILKTTLKIDRSANTNRVFEPVCVDLTVLQPRYATPEKSSSKFCETFLWQKWKNGNERVNIELFNSDAAYLCPKVTSISSTDLFFSKYKASENFDCATRAFVSRLRKSFKNDTIIWLVPDFLNDFELEIIRRNINAFFPNAEPLPRSVAAVFEQIDYSNIKNDGFSIIVVDNIGGKTCATKLIARHDPELKIRLPETSGFFWERCPTVIISPSNAVIKTGKIRERFEIITVDSNGKWRDKSRAEQRQVIAPDILERDPRIGQFELCLDLTDSPVEGGIHLHALQKRVGNIPLWRDHVPELSIKGMVDGLYQRFFLVGKNTTVRPVRGETVPISINARFPLPAGRPFYSFPLYQGEKEDEIGFSARLDSPVFPLKKEAVCKLNLTFEYGADEPYTLSFIPLDKSFPAVRATWRRTEEIIITDAPAPEYPTPMTWENLMNFPDMKFGGTINLTQEIVSTARNLNKWLELGYENTWNYLKKNIKGWCRFLFLSVWRDGRSILDSECPTESVNATKELFTTLHRIITIPDAEEHGISEFDVMILFCAMHKDMPDEYIVRVQQWIEERDPKYARPIGYALGDVSKDWQQTMLSDLMKKPNNFTLNVLSYAIWREQYFIEKLSAEELRGVLKALSIRLVSVKPLKSNSIFNDKRQIPQWRWARDVAEPLELLLGLLRTRASTNPEIKMLLQPHQEITKEFAKRVERVTEIITHSNFNLFSRVQIDIQKPTGDRTPELLYALRLYLTGDDGANAIHITSISDND